MQKPTPILIKPADIATRTAGPAGRQKRAGPNSPSPIRPFPIPAVSGGPPGAGYLEPGWPGPQPRRVPAPRAQRSPDRGRRQANTRRHLMDRPTLLCAQENAEFSRNHENRRSPSWSTENRSPIGHAHPNVFPARDENRIESLPTSRRASGRGQNRYRAARSRDHPGRCVPNE